MDWKAVVAYHGGPKHITMDSASAANCCREVAEAAGTVWYPDCPDGWLVVGPEHMKEAHPDRYAVAIK